MSTTETHPTGETHRLAHHAGQLHVAELPGDGPPIVLMHGFPDDHHIYDRLTPLLDQRTIAFDFLGYGQSDRPAERSFTTDDRQQELGSVVEQLDLDRSPRRRDDRFLAACRFWCSPFVLLRPKR
jgi:pimeloyl-ACP methyl ester carboxylesterase